MPRPTPRSGPAAPAIVKTPLAGGGSADVALDEPTAALAKSLPEGARLYFDLDVPHRMIEVTRLQQTRARPDGIANAARYMAQAATGAIPRRVPIRVTPAPDSMFVVEDGNSTVTIARAAGWVMLPCIVRPSA
jgi:hypothetical protein